MLIKSSLVLVLMAMFSIHLPEGRTVLLLPALLLVYIQRASIRIEPELRRIGIMFMLYVFFFTVVSADPSRSAKGAYDIARGLLVFFPALWLGMQLARAREKSIAMFVGLVFILANFAFAGVYSGQKYYGFHDNPNNVAVTLTAYLFLLMAFCPCPRADFGKWALPAFAAGICAALFLLILANSRGAWLGVAVAFSLVVMLLPGVARRLKLTLILAAAAGFLVLVLLADWKGFGYNTVGARIEIWKGLLSLTVPDHIWLGYGINYIKHILMASGLPTLTAHNVLLELFVSTGIIGMMAFLYIAYRLTVFMLRQKYAQGAVLYAGIGGLAAFLVMGQFDLKFSSFNFIGMVSCFLGLIYSQRLQAVSVQQDKDVAGVTRILPAGEKQV